MKKKNNNGFKIGGVLAAIAVIIYWGNSIFNKVGSSGFSKSEKKITSIQCSLVSVREDAKDVTKYYVNNNLVKEDLTIDIYHKNKSVWSSDGNFGSITVWNDNVIVSRSNDSLTNNGKPFLNLENNNQYRVNHNYNLQDDGYIKTTVVVIDKNSGSLEFIASEKVFKNDPNSVSKLLNMSTLATGICDKVKNKNL